MDITVYSTFDSIFSMMHTFLKPLQVKIAVQVIATHMNINYKITCSLW